MLPAAESKGFMKTQSYNVQDLILQGRSVAHASCARLLYCGCSVPQASHLQLLFTCSGQRLVPGQSVVTFYVGVLWSAW